MGATRVELGLQAAFGKLKSSPVIFEPCQSLQYEGVLFLLPFLIANGLFSYRDYYAARGSGPYYSDNRIEGFYKIKKIKELCVDKEQPTAIVTPMMVVEMFRRRTFLFLNSHPLSHRGISDEDKELPSNSCFPIIDNYVS